jgi:hypothetical protein
MSPVTGHEPDGDKWRGLAVNARSAAAALGYVMPNCLPGEPDACGIGFYQHAWAHLVVLTAVADHHLLHFTGAPDVMKQQMYDHTVATLAAQCENPPAPSP